MVFDPSLTEVIRRFQRLVHDEDQGEQHTKARCPLLLNAHPRVADPPHISPITEHVEYPLLLGCKQCIFDLSLHAIRG